MKHDAANNLVRHIIGFNIRMLRDRAGHNQTRFAEMVGINRSYLNQIEQGKMNASVDKLVLIADGLDVPLTELFKGLEDAAPSRLPHNTTYATVQIPKGR